MCRAEYDNLLESSPSVDLDIIGMFNKKFNDKYPNVRKPIVCNGLKEIIPYKGKSEPEPLKEIKEEEEEQLEIEIQVEP